MAQIAFAQEIFAQLRPPWSEAVGVVRNRLEWRAPCDGCVGLQVIGRVDPVVHFLVGAVFDQALNRPKNRSMAERFLAELPPVGHGIVLDACPNDQRVIQIIWPPDHILDEQLALLLANLFERWLVRYAHVLSSIASM